MIFSCKACPCKDKHIADLQKQIEFMKRQLAPAPSLPTLQIEANKILDGANDEQVVINNPTGEDMAHSEETAILMGEHEHWTNQ